MQLPNMQFDRLSFWLGFIIATAFWWILNSFRPMLPRLRDQIQQAIKNFRQRNLAGAEQYLLRETLRRAQRMHAASSLFALDEIVITPRLLAPHFQALVNEDENWSFSAATQLVPYLPDWPELTSPMGITTLSAWEAMQKGHHIAIIGQPGSGKTVALAHLASQLARQLPAAEGEQTPQFLPLLVHVLDLDITLIEDKDPLDNLRQAIIHQASVIAQPQITSFFQTVFSGRMDGAWKPILLLDGLDELPSEDLLSTARYLRALLKQHPQIQAIVTASSDYVDGLTKVGFIPLGIASWTSVQRIEFLERWSQLWVNQFLPEIQKQVPEPGIDPVLINSWLLNDIGSESPFEWTLKVWSAYAGDLNGSGAVHLLDTYVARYIAAGYRAPLTDLARKFVTRQTASMSFDDVEQILSGTSISEPLSAVTAPQDVLDADMDQKPGKDRQAKRKGKRSISSEAAIVSPGERMIGILTGTGLLVRRAGNRLSFASLAVMGYLAAQRLSPEDAAGLVDQLTWTSCAQSLRFVAANSLDTPWIDPLIRSSQPPLHRPLLIAARWLAEAPTTAAWRINLMRQLAGLIQNETLPVSVRARCAAAFVTSRDPSSVRLFRQLVGAESSVVRRIGLIACGAMGLTQSMNEILSLLADLDENVRNTACLAIGALPGSLALNTMVEILTQSDEEMRQVAAEALALRPIDGHKILEDALHNEDLLTRRAAVAGIVQIRDEWARQLLEKTAIEDSQWIVRNAASQALETFQHHNPLIPTPLPVPSESPWLLDFASRLGQGISPDRPATEILLSALKSGSLKDQVGAMEYLRNEANEETITAFYNAIYGDQYEIHEPAVYALWWMSLSGVNLPDPMKYGLG